MATPIVEVDGLIGYGVDRKGKCYTRKNNRWGLSKEWKEMKLSNDGMGYLYFHVYSPKKSVQKIHRLVAKTFLPNPNNYPIVRHLDGNSLNNKVENLAWGTQKDNMQDAVFHGMTTRGIKSATAKLDENQVKDIKKMIAKGYKNVEIAANFIVSRTAINHIRKNLTWKHITI